MRSKVHNCLEACRLIRYLGPFLAHFAHFAHCCIPASLNSSFYDDSMIPPARVPNAIIGALLGTADVNKFDPEDPFGEINYDFT